MQSRQTYTTQFHLLQLLILSNHNGLKDSLRLWHQRTNDLHQPNSCLYVARQAGGMFEITWFTCDNIPVMLEGEVIVYGWSIFKGNAQRKATTWDVTTSAIMFKPSHLQGVVRVHWQLNLSQCLGPFSLRAHSLLPPLQRACQAWGPKTDGAFS